MASPKRPVTGAPCTIELLVPAPTIATSFYTALFGWSADDEGDTIALRSHGALVAHARAVDPALTKPGWLVHLIVDDPTSAAEAATRHGGSVAGHPGPDRDEVTLRDPGGALVGARRPGAAGNIEVLHVPGTPTWFELHARNYDATLDFYRHTFGWADRTTTSEGALAYCTLIDHQTKLAGIMDATEFLPDGDAATWSVYFATADLDADLRRACEIGGTVVLAALATPSGRLAEVEDTTGARFLLLQSPS